MTIRDLVISFGYEINEQAEKEVNSSIDTLKSHAAKTLGATEVAYDVNQASEQKVSDSINALHQHADNELSGMTVGYEVDRASERQAKDSIRSIRSMATKFLAVIGIGFSLAALGSLSSEFSNINDQIRDATRGMGDQHEIQQRIKRAANDARIDYAKMADTVTRLAQNTDTFGSIEEAASFATLMAQDFAAAGKSQERAAYLTRYITMDLQKGVVSTRALNTMLRDAPHMAIRLAESLGVTTYELQEMARSGEVSAQAMRDVFEDSADDIAKRFGEVDMDISDALRNVRNSWGLFVTEMDSTLGISRTIARVIVNGFNQILFMLRRGQEAFMRLADRMGGVNNLMRLLAISAGAIFAALNSKKIMSFLKSTIKLLGKVKLSMLALVAVIAILALLIDDFIAFMRGDDSLLGEMLEKFGIDAGEVREIIHGLWETIKGILPFVKELAKMFGRELVRALQFLLPILMSLLRQILPPIMKFIRRLIPMIASFARQLIPLVVRAFEKLIPILIRLIESVLPALMKIIEALFPVIMSIIENVLPVVIRLLETFLPIILQVIEIVLPILLSLLDALIPIITFVAELISTVLGAAFEGLMPVIDAFMHILGGLIDFIAGVFTGDWQRAWEGIRNIFYGIISGLGALFKIPLNLIISGLNVFIRGLNRLRIPDWVPGVGGRGIDIPEIPMLAKGSDFSPDTFIAGEEGPELITNAKGSKVFTAKETTGIFNKLKGMGGIYQALKDIANLALAPGAGDAVSAITAAVSNVYITLYQDISNEFYGDRAGQEKSSEAMDQATEDATGELSRALAYVR